MNGEKADLAHNDPPYGMKKESVGVMNDNLNYEDLLEFNKKWIPLEFTYLKENGSWYCWGIDEPLMDIYVEILKPYFQEKKATFRNLITWDKGNGQGQNSELTRSFATADEKCLFVMIGEESLVQNKDQFPEEWKPLLNYFIQERDKMKWKNKDVIDITGKTSASHYFTRSQFQIPTEEHYNKIQEAANGKAFTKKFQEFKKKANTILNEMKESRAYFNNVHDNMNNVWHFNRHIKDGTEGNHATPKPIDLCNRVIKSSCPDNGLVLDVFLGSGSTMVAAHQLKRKCYGMELDPKYCQVIIDRMLKLDSSLIVEVNGKKYEQN
jgi:DNA modification methylase